RAYQHLLEERTGSQELLVLLVGAEAHDAFDPGAVVPAAIEEDHFTPGWQMRNIALEIPLPTLLLGGRAERDYAADARVEARGDALNDAALAGRIPALEDDDDLEALQAHPLLQLDEFELQANELIGVFVIGRRLPRQLAVADDMPALLDCRRF